MPAWQRLRLAALFALGSVVMRSAGCVVNDMWDRDLDRQVARTRGRPLASGALRMRQAGWFLLGLLLLGLWVLASLNRLCWALGLGSLVLVGLYPLAKRVTWWPQLVMGFTFGFGAPMGYAAATGRIDGILLSLYAAAILWDLGFDTVYGFQDMEDDALVGVKSTSRLVAAQPRRFVAGCYASMLAALALAGHLAGVGPLFWPALLGPAVAARDAGAGAGDPLPGDLPALVPRQPRSGTGGGAGDPGGAVAMSRGGSRQPFRRDRT